MNDAQRLAKLLRAESTLKRTTRGYTADGVYWRTGMPLLWEVRLSLGQSANGKALAEAHGTLKLTEKGYDPSAPRWKKAMGLIDRVEADLHRSPVPDLGPVRPATSRARARSRRSWSPTTPPSRRATRSGSTCPMTAAATARACS